MSTPILSTPPVYPCGQSRHLPDAGGSNTLAQPSPESVEAALASIHLTPLTAGRLATPPTRGGTHRWLAQAAGGLHNVLPEQKCFEFLRRCCDIHVKHRDVPDREIADAVEFAYGATGDTVNYGRGSIDWPEPNPAAIAKLLATVEPAFDGVTDTGLGPADVLSQLFRAGELVCSGLLSDLAIVHPVESVARSAECDQFICVNPMKGRSAINKAGRLSERCQNNVRLRRYLVAEFDDEALTKRNQAQLTTTLAKLAPFVMAVDSGGKSVHAWYWVEGMGSRDQARFFAAACLLGADPTRWDICGWVRMPGGMRCKSDGSRVRQRVLYWNPAAISTSSKKDVIHG